MAPEAFAASVRYATSTNRIYVEGGGPITLTEIKAALPSAPLEQVDPAKKIWYLQASVQLEDGSVLHLRGESVGGDVNELRMLSNNDVTSPKFVNITADHGGINVEGTKVTSWDPAVNGPDTDFSNGRAFMRVRSSLAADGITARESRMDVIKSEVAYLGYNASEAYGLSWKVVGTAPDLFSKVQVWGNILNSKIHHNYFGVYTYGLQDGIMRENEVYENVQYGLDPHDDSDNLIIEKNYVHGNGNHGIIASQRCDNAVIRDNRSIGNMGNGIMVHRSSDDALIENNETSKNEDAGIAIFATARTLVRNNTITDNGLAGLRISVGSADNVIEDNLIANSGQFAIYMYRGTDLPNSGDDGRPKRNVFRNNEIQQAAGDVFKLSDGDDNRFEANNVTGNASRVYIANAPGTVFKANRLPASLAFEINGTDVLPTRVDFVQQERVGLSLNSHSFARFTDSQGAIFDVERNDLFTTVSGGESLLEVDQKKIGGATTIYRRPLFAQSSTGVLSAFPTVWATDGDQRRGWTAKVEDAAATVQYSLADLTPGATYEAFHGTTSLGSFVADTSGRISFSTTPGNVLTQSYEVVKISGPSGGGGGGGGGGGKGGGGGGGLDLTLLAGLLGLGLARRYLRR